MKPVRLGCVAIGILLTMGCSSKLHEWQATTSQDTLQAYEKFLQENPKSAFTEPAKERMKELRWREAQRINTPEALQKFSEAYPKDELAQKALARKELVEWRIAQDSNTPQRYLEFVNAYPHGKFTVKAQQLFQETGLVNLSKAVSEGNAEEVQSLLALHVDLNDTTENGTTPLMWAALKGDTEIGQILLDYGALVNKQTDEGVTALMLAAQEGHGEMLDLLLERGANPRIENIRDETAMDLAARTGRIDLLRVLLNAAIPEGSFGEEPAIRAPSTKILVTGIEQVIRKSAPDIQPNQEVDINILAVSNYDRQNDFILVYSTVALKHGGKWVPLHAIKHFKLRPLPSGEWNLEMVAGNSSDEKPVGATENGKES